MEVKQEWSDSVQAYWKELENQLVKLVDELAPLTIVINENIPLPMNEWMNETYIVELLWRVPFNV